MAGKLIVHGINSFMFGTTVDVYLDNEITGHVKVKSTEEFQIMDNSTVHFRPSGGLSQACIVKVFAAGITEVQCNWDRLSSKLSVEVLNESPEAVKMRLEDEICSRVENEQRKISENENREYRMRCNVCGQIFCFTDADIKANQSHQKWAKAHAVGSLFGTRLDMYGQQNQMQAELDKIVDYSRCPNCRSMNLTDISHEEFDRAKSEGENLQVQQKTSNVAEELKQFKELLDMGIITQEEFDAKKKQLLGL